jgi:hypothetical protein
MYRHGKYRITLTTASYKNHIVIKIPNCYKNTVTKFAEDFQSGCNLGVSKVPGTVANPRFPVIIFRISFKKLFYVSVRNT